MSTTMCLTIKLVLDNIIKGLQQKEGQVVVLSSGEQEPVGGEGFQKMQEFIGCHHGQTLQVRRHYKV